MRKLFYFLALTIFVFNSSISVAWAGNFNCDKMNMAVEKSVQNNIPCHDGQKENKSGHHCDGVCMCVHASVPNVLFFSDIKLSELNYSDSIKFIITNDTTISYKQSPEDIPPITIS